MRNIVFIGGGHSNTIAIRNLMQKIYSLQPEIKNKILTQNKFHLVSEYKHSAYSGMIPGSICGYYNNQESFIDLEKFSEIHNCNFINKKVIEILPKEGKILFDDNSNFFDEKNSEMNFDLLSINIGSKTYNSGKVKGVEEFSIQTRPISNLLHRIQEFEKNFKNNFNKIKICIVGSGVAGIELAFSLTERFKKIYNFSSEIFIISNSKDIIPDFESNVSNDLLLLADQKNIKIIKNSECVEITEKGVFYKEKSNNQFDKSNFLDCDMIIWATGAGAQELNFKSNLRLDSRGFILVKDTLQSVEYENIFGAGDCIQLEKYSSVEENKSYKSFPRKSGVYAVREGSILAENLFKFLLDKKDEFVSYSPQTSFLKLITLGNEEAFGTKFGISFQGKWVWNLKKHIDVNFVRMFEKDIEKDVDKSNEQKINSSCISSENKCQIEKSENCEKSEKSEKNNNDNKSNKIDSNCNSNRLQISNEQNEFEFSPENCITKLKYSSQDLDFEIQLKILDRLNTDEKLLTQIKNLL
jgi:selenide, water dikinase